MITEQAKITTRGQVTIPAEVRDALGLREGDTVAFEVDSQDQAKLRAVRVGSPFAKYAGVLRENRDLDAQRIAEDLREGRERWLPPSIQTSSSHC